MRIKPIGIIFKIFTIFLLSNTPLLTQPYVEYLGLSHKQNTAVDVNYGILAAGTNGNGVYWKSTSQIMDTVWNFIGLDSVTVYTVYPHKSGPLGWAVGAGIQPTSLYQDYIYCSFVGNAFTPGGMGIVDSLVTRIQQLDGFPDPSICGETYAATGQAIYRRNYGDSLWVPIYTATVEGYIQTLKTHEEYPGAVLAGGAEGFAGRIVLKSLDYGDTWEFFTPPDYVRHLDFAGDSAQTIFVLTSSNVYRSIDGGQSWTEIFNNTMMLRTINKLAYHAPTQKLYLAGSDDFETRALFFRSSDLGSTWEEILLNISDPVYDMEMASDGFIYLATPDAGIYRINPVLLNLPRNIDESELSEFHLYPNYPNPFNSGTTFDFFIPNSSPLKIEIFNLMGQRVCTLWKGQRTAGRQRLYWNGQNDNGKDVPSGVYVYRIESAGFAEMKKILLIR